MGVSPSPVVVLISASSEWRSTLAYFGSPPLLESPFGGYFQTDMDGTRLSFMKSGWGKISAAASTQYAIHSFSPRLLINLGTCGGFAGRIQVGEIFLVESCLVYDIVERMGDARVALENYATSLDLSFLHEPFPHAVRRGRILSADQDIDPARVPDLLEHYQAVVADWESGAIAWTATQNRVPCLILRGVTDLVSSQVGEAYNHIELFHDRSEEVMKHLLQELPAWIKCCGLP